MKLTAAWAALAIGCAARPDVSGLDACERASDCVVSAWGCCDEETWGPVAVRRDAEDAFLHRDCPDDPYHTRSGCIAVCRTFGGGETPYVVATCRAGRCALVDVARGTPLGDELRACSSDAECVTHDRCTSPGLLDCRMPMSPWAVALTIAGAARYEQLVDPECGGGSAAGVVCERGLCELREPP